MIKEKIVKGKKYYTIQLSYNDSKGKRHQPRFSKDLKGRKITSIRDARSLEHHYHSQLRARVEEDYSKLPFKDYHARFLTVSKLHYRLSTYQQYSCNLMKWMDPKLYKKPLDEITKGDIHSMIYEYMLDKGASAHVMKRVLKSLRKILQSSLEDGLINRNPALGIKVKTPPPKVGILNRDEEWGVVRTLLGGY